MSEQVGIVYQEILICQTKTCNVAVRMKQISN